MDKISDGDYSKKPRQAVMPVAQRLVVQSGAAAGGLGADGPAGWPAAAR
ncbi:hypothetical protein LL965_01965 [Xanthomonas cassavae CFBP 4642]|uniref:Uncharacterized protein n=1 Tax=Xanthomonas cassavae CFBP 4642 TaxID=1219375 RepID=A0ABS8H9R1_9XANT|nr:hypothetical protein [Xanthomonas cassavae]MCC4618901.1 hypothetical protein [Xanthomonas cassavae CFBP 4642]